MEHRYRCSGCGWDGLKKDIMEYKHLCGKPFPVCPGCGKHREAVVDGTLKYNRSILTGYAVSEKK